MRHYPSDLLPALTQEIDGWGLSPRGAGYLFGGDVVEKVGLTFCALFQNCSFMLDLTVFDFTHDCPTTPVQLPKQLTAHRPGAPTSHGGIQVHV